MEANLFRTITLLLLVLGGFVGTLAETPLPATQRPSHQPRPDQAKVETVKAQGVMFTLGDLDLGTHFTAAP